MTDNCSNVMRASNELAEEHDECEDENDDFAVDDDFLSAVNLAFGVESFGCQCHLLELVIKDSLKV